MKPFTPSLELNIREARQGVAVGVLGLHVVILAPPPHHVLPLVNVIGHDMTLV